ncbi:acyltransferase [Gordonia zhaorongruii]|uniref:acyltransferase n=1 Tax=Gordonia zhaorongruii TaxID=2597659 RepID=UPI001043BC25|nr:acyltransferase [Gordonia zhaorongruii]
MPDIAAGTGAPQPARGTRSEEAHTGGTQTDVAPADASSAEVSHTGETPAGTAQPGASEQAAPGDKVTTAKVDRHLYQIDFVRLVTFAGVILDHVVLGMVPYVAVAAQGVGLLLRYTRYCFFALTGFVLTYQYRNRDLHAPTFWRRRYKLIGLPFLAWSLFYWVNRHYQQGGVENLRDIFASPHDMGLAAKSIVYDLITGHAAYHLYFLSVSMQIYLIFPALLWVIKRSWGYHRYMLALSAAVQAWFMFHMVRPPHEIFTHGVLDVLWRYLGVTILPYQFFVFAGCLAAYHFGAFTEFMKRWRWPIVGASLAAIIATLIYFKSKADISLSLADPAAGGEEMFRATNVFMFHNSFAFLGIICILYIGGTIWQNRRSPGSVADTVMRKASDRSFGIYLGHVLVLSEVMGTTRRWTDLPTSWNIVFTYALTLAFTVFLVEVLRRSPVSLVTTGREREDWRKQDPIRSGIVGAIAVIAGGLLRVFADTSIGSLLAAIGALLVVSAIVVLVRQMNESREERAADRAAALAQRAPDDQMDDPVTDTPIDEAAEAHESAENSSRR